MAIKTMYNLCGEQGAKGDDGITPHIGFNGNWFIGETDTGVKAQGPRGIQGFQGIQGEQGGQGVKGENGTSFRICDTNFTAHTTEDIDSFATFNYQESFDKSGIIGFGDTKVGDTIGLLIPNSDTSKDSVYLGLVSEILENSIVCLGRGALHSGVNGSTGTMIVGALYNGTITTETFAKCKIFNTRFQLNSAMMTTMGSYKKGDILFLVGNVVGKTQKQVLMAKVDSLPSQSNTLIYLIALGVIETN